jgi:ribosomal protein L32
VDEDIQSQDSLDPDDTHLGTSKQAVELLVRCKSDKEVQQSLRVCRYCYADKSKMEDNIMHACCDSGHM